MPAVAQHFALWANLCGGPEIVGQADHLDEMTIDGQREVGFVSWYKAERGSKFISDRMLDWDPQRNTALGDMNVNSGDIMVPLTLILIS